MRVAFFILVVLTLTLSITCISHGALQNKKKLTKNKQNEIKKTGINKIATTKIRHTKALVPNKISNFIIKSRSTKSKKLKKLIIKNKLRVIPDKSTRIRNIKFFKSKIFTNIVTKPMVKQSWKLKHKHTTSAKHKTIQIKVMEVTRHVVPKKNIPNKIINSKFNSVRTVSKHIKSNSIDLTHHTSKKSRNFFKNNSKDRPIKTLLKQNQRVRKTSRFTKRWPSSKLLPLKKNEYKSLKGVPRNDRTIKLDVKKYKYDTLTNFSKLMIKSIVSKRNTIPNRLFNKLNKVKSTNKKLQDLKRFGLRYNKMKPLNSVINVDDDARVNNIGLKNVKHNVVTKKSSSMSKKPSSRAKYKNLKPRSLEINAAKHKQIKTTKPFKNKINIPRKNTLRTLGHKKLSSTTKPNKFKTSVRKLTTAKRVIVKKITTKKKFPVIKKENKNPSNFFKMFMDSQEIQETLRKKKNSGSTNILSKTSKKLKTRSSTQPEKSLETNTKVFTTIATSSTETFYISSSASTNDISIETPSKPIISSTPWTTENDQIISTNINPKSITSTSMLNITDANNFSLSQTSNVRYVRKTRWIKKLVRKKIHNDTSSSGGTLEPQYDNVEFDLPMTMVNRILSFDEEPIEPLKIIDVPGPLGIKPAAIKNHPFKQAGPNKPFQLTPATKVRKNRLPLVDYDFLSGTKLKKMVSHDSTRLIMIGTITFLAVMLAFVAILVFCIAFT